MPAQDEATAALALAQKLLTALAFSDEDESLARVAGAEIEATSNDGSDHL